MTTISPERLADLDTVHLDPGHHGTFESGHCAMEVVAWLAGERHSDRPECVARVLADFVRRLNDAMLDSERHRLREYLPRLVGTTDAGRNDERRYRMVSDPDASGASRWLDALDAVPTTFPALHDEIDGTHLIAASAWIASHTRPVGAGSTIDAYLAASVIENVVVQMLERARETDEPKVTTEVMRRRLIRRIEREDGFATYRDLRSGAIDDLLLLLDRLIEG